MADFEENLQDVLDTLEKCRSSLVLSGDRETAQLVSVAILGLRIKLNRIEDPELKALCDAMLKESGASSPIPKVQEPIRQRASLKLVK